MNYEAAAAGIDIDIDKLQALAPKFVSMAKFPVGCKVLYNLRCSHEAKLMQAKSTQVEEVFMHFENGRRVYKVKVTPETSDAHEMYFYEDQLVYGIGSPVRVSKLGTNKTLDGVVLFSEREKGTDGVQKVIYTVQYSDYGENDIAIESRIIADRIKFRAKGIDGNKSASNTNKQSQPTCSQEGDVNLEGKGAENSPYFSAVKSCSNSEYSDHNSYDTTNRDQVSARKRSCVYYDVEHAKVPKREVKCGAQGELKAENTVSVKGLSHDYNSESEESRNYVDCDSNGEEEKQQHKEVKEDVSETEEENSDDDFAFDCLEEQEQEVFVVTCKKHNAPDNNGDESPTEQLLTQDGDEANDQGNTEASEESEEEEEPEEEVEEPAEEVEFVGALDNECRGNELTEGLKIHFTTCLPNSPDFPNGRTNVYQSPETKAVLQEFHDEVSTYGRMHNQQSGKRLQKTECVAYNIMCNTDLVLNCPKFKGLTVADYFSFNYARNFRHFPNPHDKFVDMDGEVHVLHHTHERKVSKRLDGTIGGHVEVTDWLEIPLEGSRGENRSGELKKLYPRKSWTVKQYIRNSVGNLEVVGTFRMLIRIHVIEKFNMIDRAMKLGVPEGKILDPMEKVWYLHLKNARFTDENQGLRVPIGSGVASLECSHIDHGVRGLDMIRIETKGMNMCRVVPCFNKIACSAEGCNWVLDAGCRHTPKCTKTFWIICNLCTA